MLRYWEGPLKELQAQRKEQSKGKKGGEMELIVIPDDDESKGMTMAELEAKSLEEAAKGNILVGSDEVLDDGYGNGGDEVMEVPKPVEPEKTSMVEPKPAESESTSPTTVSREDRKAELIEQLSVEINHIVIVRKFFLDLFQRRLISPLYRSLPPPSM